MADVLNNIWSKLYAWAMPSALTLGAFWLLVYPQAQFKISWLDTATAEEKAIVFVALAGTIAFTLSTFSTPLYRILEGYLLWPACLQRWGVERQLARKRKMEGAVNGTGWKRGLALEALALYPMNDEQVVPTRFGNALRSFETYGKTRFNLDSQTLWSEICAAAPEYLQTEEDRAKAAVDFFVAGIYLCAAFGVVTFVIAARQSFPLDLMVITLASFGIAVLSHWVAVRTTQNWSQVVQAIVNLGRVPLAKQLGLALPDTLAEEQKMWEYVTRYVYFATPAVGVALDVYRKKPERPGVNAENSEAD
ncbi:hypothetical protein [Dongia sedimenti]|uniref:Uncharacterized protein n=1 Tax=Dongia sedimenti TaxID=3064282 RepID=A0ABU0YKG3_9PROT|nr:hypothetical protein [Rhodospirillaceae bacterium R-7]